MDDFDEREVVNCQHRTLIGVRRQSRNDDAGERRSSSTHRPSISAVYRAAAQA
jgi:hypothetical protein